MFQFELKNYQTPLGENVTRAKHIQIENDVECFVCCSSSQEKIVTPIINKIIDCLLDTLPGANIYDSFTIVLEQVNYFLKTFLEDSYETDLDVIIGIVEGKVLHFSKIGNATCTMINRKKEYVQISDQEEISWYFSTISSGDLHPYEIFFFGTHDLRDVVTVSDWKDMYHPEDKLSYILDDVEHILLDEKFPYNTSIIAFWFSPTNQQEEPSKWITSAKNIFYTLMDNNFFKKIFAFFLYEKEVLEKKGKIIKNIVFFSGIIVSALLLFWIISGLLWSSVQENKTEIYTKTLQEASDFTRLASQVSDSDPEKFAEHIAQAEALIASVEEKQLFLKDTQKLREDIAIMKKIHNGVEIFSTDLSHLVFKGDFSGGIKVLEKAKQLYVVTAKNVYGPIVSGKDIKRHELTSLDEDDECIDGAVVGDDIILITKKWRVLRFDKTSTFSNVTVEGQTTWEGSPILETYNSHLYMLNKDRSQLIQHRAGVRWAFASGTEYLNKEHQEKIWAIANIGIDGGIYILAQDGKMYKYFSQPSREVRGITLNKLPQNYSIENKSVSLFVRPNLKYVYFLIDQSIFVFEPNSTNYQNTQSLKFLGQIEGSSEPFLSIYVVRDGEIQVLTKSGIYKINFEITDEKLHLR